VTNSESNFIAYVRNFYYGEPAFLLSVDGNSIEWMMSRFEALASSNPDGASFVLGDGNPIASDGRCLFTVQKADQENCTRVAIAEPGKYCWIISAKSAERFRALLSGLMKSKSAAHQYLDSDDLGSPVVIASKGEYSRKTIRSWLELTNSAE
jgi:hypothetical protein